MAAPVTEVAANFSIEDGYEAGIETQLKLLEGAKGCSGVCCGDFFKELDGKKSAQVLIG